MPYVKIDPSSAPVFRNQTKEFVHSKHFEQILSGPYETGKTFSALYKMHILLCMFPKSRLLLCRQTYKSLLNTAVITYEQKVLPKKPLDRESQKYIYKLGKSKPESYTYPNGSHITLGGLDNPDKILSAEYDFIYVPQCEEISLNSWETLLGRATGRSGNAPYTLVMGDCNPSYPKHWIKTRDGVKLYQTSHKDNPTLWDEDLGEWTTQGKKSIEILSNLTGLRYNRGYKGLWVAAEGVVYSEYNSETHLVPRFRIPSHWTKIRAIDFGVNHPFVCQWWAIDELGNMYLYREWYMTGKSTKEHAKVINHYSEGENILYTVCDHSASDRLTLHENGIPTIPAYKAIKYGIDKVKDRLRENKIFILHDSLIEVDSNLGRRVNCTKDEFEEYIYSPKNINDIPVDDNNHGMDSMRYAVVSVDRKIKSGTNVRPIN